ncbi:MAG: divergent PAP2 family protein [Deltaproteobacteria bacterium]
MELHFDIFLNPVVVVPIFSWLIAQITKVALDLKKFGKINVRRFVGSGGMPSSHTAFVTSLATVVGAKCGWDSPELGIAFAVALIVMYDATGVRRAAGKQAQVLNTIIEESQKNGRLTNLDVKLKELIGHTPFEVLVGAVIGISIALLCI